ncbi:MAG: glutamate-1-semialdehyde 2,1-aminomutase [Actinobacteria bacterium]|nr:glutamate-1-semialdehyde 2,1-aminomutase [Actinomycetota bacterium]MCL6104221.1 glutamate-1-semialdehyde 2,1-aminomutase [Actinomycetota bacterium]
MEHNLAPDELWARACRVIPGGVNSPVRAFKAVGGTPYFVARAEGPFVWESRGRRFIDYVQAYGASILGHAHPAVVGAIASKVVDGTSYGAPTVGEILLAEAICERVPGCEQVRLVSSGTEATMSALRVARGFTARNKIIKFAGCYHGHSDSLLAASGSGVATLGLEKNTTSAVPGCLGVTPNLVADTIVVPYNRVPKISQEVACVIVEPAAANMGLVAPVEGFLEGLRKACNDSGALLIFDEVITGFRLSRGGASEFYGIKPDLWCFGKVIGGGLPIGAFGGRREVMEVLAPLGEVYQAGTLSGNPLAVAAGLAVLKELDVSGANPYQRLTQSAKKLADILSEAANQAGISVQLPLVGPLVGIFFTDEGPVTNYDMANKANDNGAYAKFFWGMLNHGIAFAPGSYEVMFPSLAHTELELEYTAQAAAEVFSSF